MAYSPEEINKNPVPASFFKGYLISKGISEDIIFKKIAEKVKTPRLQFDSSWRTKLKFTNTEVETYIRGLGLSTNDFKTTYDRYRDDPRKFTF